MANVLMQFIDRIRGSGEAAITLPPMDGALRPNNRIEEADRIAAASAPDNLVRHEGRILFSSGANLLALAANGETEEIGSASSPINFLTSDGSAALAMGLAEGRIEIRGGPHDGRTFDTFGDTPVRAPSAAAFGDRNTLYVCLASRENDLADWKRDLMSYGSTGSVWKLDLASGSVECLARGLAFPYGVVPFAGGGVIVSESWRHRVLHIPEGGRIEPVLDELPGYPSRLVRGDGDDLWMCVFAPRTQLIEFVLHETEYRQRMIAEIDPEYWIAPSLHHPNSHLEPMQGGGLKQLGELKPWAPSRSIGLVVRLDAQGQPLESLHSRANGKCHGVTSCLADADGLFVASKGGDLILRAQI